MTILSAKWAYTLSALVGAGSWVAVAQMTGRREAWDSEIYFSGLLPGLWVCCVGLGFFAPVRPWRWGFVPFAAQAVVMIVQEPTGQPAAPRGRAVRRARGHRSRTRLVRGLASAFG